MRHLACLIVCWMITAVGVHAAGLDLDIVSFYGDDTLTYCEVYAGVQREALIYSRLSADSAVARFSLVCSVAQDGSMLRSDTLDTEDSGDTTRVMAGDAYFPYVFRYLLSPGDYQFSVVLLQTEWSERTDFVRDVTIPAIVEESGISDLALGAELAFGANPSAFTRNGVRFVPNPSNFYGSGLPMLYYYAECYGLDTTRHNDSVTVTRMVIAGTSGLDAKKPATRRLAIPGSSMVVADGFPAYTLRTGTYTLIVLVQQEGQPERRVSRKFWVYRPEDFEQGRELSLDADFNSAVATGGSDILHSINPDSALNLMEYVLTKQELRRARDMDADGKRRYLLEHWRRESPDDPEAANRYFARIAEANRRYGFLDREGWRTDRGRVLVQLGEPDAIDRRYAEAQVPDHELWTYERMEGGVLFVFMDRSGFGDLDLVHSTKRGEIYNPEWMQSVQNRSSVIRGLRE